MAEMKTFSVSELSNFDGEGGRKIYFSVEGVIFDVTAGRDFYGPEGPYAVFAGKECARALALLKIDEAACNDNLSGVDEAGLKILAEWVKKFKEKYPIKGRLVDPNSSSTKAAASIAATVPTKLKNSATSGQAVVQPKASLKTLSLMVVVLVAGLAVLLASYLQMDMLPAWMK